MDAVARFNQAGVKSSVMMAPLIPGISDRPEQIAAVRSAAKAAGAESCHQVRLHLRGVRGHFLEWLSNDSPQLSPKYERLYPERRPRIRATRQDGDNSQLALEL
jgi:DNA repair photolyase